MLPCTVQYIDEQGTVYDTVQYIRYTQSILFITVVNLISRIVEPNIELIELIELIAQPNPRRIRQFRPVMCFN